MMKTGMAKFSSCLVVALLLLSGCGNMMPEAEQPVISRPPVESREDAVSLGDESTPAISEVPQQYAPFTEFEYFRAMDFYNGYAFVVRNDKPNGECGYVDKTGQFYPLYDKPDELDLSTITNRQTSSQGTTTYIYAGTIAEEFPLNATKDGLAPYYDEQRGLWGYIYMQEGRVAIEPAYIAAYGFRYDRAVVVTSDGSTHIIDTNGNTIFTGQVTENFYRHGLITVLVEERTTGSNIYQHLHQYNIINTDGEMVYSFAANDSLGTYKSYMMPTESIRLFKGETEHRPTNGGKGMRGFSCGDNEDMLRVVFNPIEQFVNENGVAYDINAKFLTGLGAYGVVFIDRQGNEQARFDAPLEEGTQYYLNDCYEGRIIRWGSPREYYLAWAVLDNTLQPLATFGVWISYEKYTFINPGDDAEPNIIEQPYLFLGNFKEGRCSFVRGDNELAGYIDSDFNEVIPASYSNLNAHRGGYGFRDFSDGVAVVESTEAGNYVYGVIDKDGSLICPFELGYRSISDFSNGVAVASVDEEQSTNYYLIDAQGNKLTQAYRGMSIPVEGTILALDWDGYYGFLAA